MKKRSTTAVLTLLLLTIWVSTIQVRGFGLQHTYANEPTIEHPDSLKIKIVAKNLSEDMHMLSTHDDEIALLIFNRVDSNTYGDCVLSLTHTFGDSSTEYTSVRMLPDTLTELLDIWLIERDQEIPIKELCDRIKKNHKRLKSAFLDTKYSSIRKYLGDEDILGCTTIQTPELAGHSTVQISGVHRADKYAYSIDIRPY